MKADTEVQTTMSSFPNPFPAPWADSWGDDEFGLWMTLNYRAAQQVFRWIGPGTFVMGSPESEPERLDRETAHPVTLTQGLWLADSACTQALWQAVMGDNPSRFVEYVSNPVETVSWNDAQKFIVTLNALIPELNARLPSEAEWEYACRAATTTTFSFGDQISPEE
ncbi:MAG: formylglycine-generating enzyme family protein, partial [Pseudomonadota bacterium]